MVDQRIDDGPCPRLVPLKDWPEAPAAPHPWQDYLLEEVHGPVGWWEEEVYGRDYCWETGPITIGPDIVEYYGDPVWIDLLDADDA